MVLGWIVAIVGVTLIHGAVGSSYSDNFKLPHTQSFDAIRLLQRNAPKASGDTDQLVIGARQGKVTDPAIRAKAEALFAQVAELPHVSSVASPYDPAGKAQISPNGDVAFANVTFDAQSNKVSTSQAKAFVDKITSASTDAVQFEVGGQVAQSASQGGDSSGLLFGFLAAAVVLFIVFGSLLATLLPLLTAGLSLGVGIGVVGLLSHVFSMASFSSELALLIGLGVGVDYALFIVTRYKQGVLRGLSAEQAVTESLDTSGRAVLFAGHDRVHRDARHVRAGRQLPVRRGRRGSDRGGVHGAIGADAAAGAAGLLRPPRAAAPRAPRAARGAVSTTDESAAWSRWTGWMQKRPAVFAVGATALLVILAIPFLSIRLGSADAGSDPANTTTRKAYDLLAKGFGPGYNGPLQLVAEVDSAQQKAAFLRVQQAVAKTPGIVGAAEPHFIPGANGRPDVAIADLYPKGSPQDQSTADLLHKVRNEVVPAAEKGTGLTVLVGGQTAIFDDFSHVLAGKLPLFIGVVVLLSFLLLMIVFRSIAIPLTAAIMNLLSAGAAFGVVTAIFQNGWGASLIGVDKTGPIEAFLPVLMFPILFGLSMDYEVFLVSRIYEEWHRRRNNSEAVAHGLAATGRTITAAAAIMVLVFGAFVLGGERIIKLFGIGLGGAVLIDAAIVRSVLVPAVMLMLGDRNWKLPAFLDRILPQVNIEGSVERLPAGDGPQREPIPEPVG